MASLHKVTTDELIPAGRGGESEDAGNLFVMPVWFHGRDAATRALPLFQEKENDQG